MNKLFILKKSKLSKDIYVSSRMMYIIEAALEYFISILVSGAYLAKITAAIGISDALTGILSAFVSLGCAFQIFSIFFFKNKPVKKWVIIFHIINQICFTLIYVVPVFNLSKRVKTLFFIAFLLAGYIISNIISSPKINWFMGLINDKKRGSFTAKKEIFSLVGGMVFTYFMGQMIDSFEEKSNINGAFIIMAITLFVLMILHSVTLIVSKEKPKDFEQGNIKDCFLSLLKNRKIRKVIILAVMWSVAMYATTPFYGSYQIKELGFSMKFIAFLSILYAFFRAIFSVFLGKYADKTCFIKMLAVCYVVAEISFLVNIFTIPSNGKVFYTLYYLLQAISMAGINSGTINLIYDEISIPQRAGAYALQQGISGIMGFLTSIFVGILVKAIQRRGLILFHVNIYAQQMVSAIGAFIVLMILIYISFAFKSELKLKHIDISIKNS